MNRLAAALAGSGLVITCLTVGTTANGAVTPRSQSAQPAGHEYTPPPIKWGRCKTDYLRSHHAKCGFLTVPLDYADPDGSTIQLAVSRVEHTTRRYQGVMLVNPGGPGGSGRIYSTLGQFVPGRSAKTYDWIGFDPRGVGASRPSLKCMRGYFHFDRPPYVPRPRTLMDVWLRRSQAYADSCAADPASRLLAHVKTVDTVMDMESLRKALGVDQINYYGFSYGTYLGQVYATRYPDRVRRFVLDSNVDPRTVWYGANLQQDVAFDKNIRVYFRWLARHNRAYHLGTRAAAIQRRYFRELHVLTKRPAGGKVGPAELTDIFTDAAYYVYDWDTIAKIYAAWMHHGQARGLIRFARAVGVGPGYDNGYAMYLATECTDASWPGWGQQVADTQRIYRQHPFLAWGNTWYNAPCSFWHAAPGEPVRVTGADVHVPVLLIDETRDAATPYEGSLYVRSIFPTASLIEGVGGTTHAGSLSGVACVDDAVARYLADGTVPARQPGNGSDKKCPPVPPPSPTKQKSGARTTQPTAPLPAALARLGGYSQRPAGAGGPTAR